MKKKWLKSPWTISISTTILGVILYLKGKTILSEFFNIVKDLYWKMFDVLNVELKLWSIILIILIFVGLRKIYFYIQKAFKEEKNNIPDFVNYKVDRLKNYRWSWDWEWNLYSQKWNVTSLRPHCPKCDTRMLQHITAGIYFYRCPRCNYRPSDSESENPQDIEAIIIDNILKGKEKY
jgi:ribosomal protein S27AE